MVLKKSIFLSFVLLVFFVFVSATRAAGQQIAENSKAEQVSLTEKKSCCTKTSLKKVPVSVNMAKMNMTEQSLENCPLKGTPECPLLKNCPKKGKSDCPIVQNCPKKGTPDCPYKKEVPSCCVEN
jgi:hypothetical protein